MMLYTTSNICQLYSISPTTLKNWCDLAKPFLSDGAKPAKGKHRYFTSDDLKIFALVKSSPDYDSAFLALSNGQRGELPSLVAEYSISLDTKDQVAMLQNRIMQLEARVLELEGERDARIRAEAERDLLRELLREAQGK